MVNKVFPALVAEEHNVTNTCFRICKQGEFYHIKLLRPNCTILLKQSDLMQAIVEAYIHEKDISKKVLGWFQMAKEEADKLNSLGEEIQQAMKIDRTH